MIFYLFLKYFQALFTCFCTKKLSVLFHRETLPFVIMRTEESIRQCLSNIQIEEDFSLSLKREFFTLFRMTCKSK